MLVEDDEVVAKALLPHLGAHGFETEHEQCGDLAVGRILHSQPDAVVLDLQLPGLDGAEVCRAVRASYAGAIVVLTSRGNELDHVLMLEYGADDFLSKPVQPAVLIAHLNAVLRRTRGKAPGSLLDFGRLTIDRLSRRVTLDQCEVTLTSAEFDLLWLLAARAGEVVSRNDMRAELRGVEDGLIDRAYDNQVSRLRKVLGDGARPPRGIKSVRGKGYLFSPDGWD